MKTKTGSNIFVCTVRRRKERERDGDSESVSPCLSIEWPKAVRGTETIILTHTLTHSHTLALVVTVIYAMLCDQCAATSSSPSPSPVWLAEHTMRRDKQWQSIRATNVAH